MDDTRLLLTVIGEAIEALRTPEAADKLEEIANDLAFAHAWAERDRSPALGGTASPQRQGAIHLTLIRGGQP